MERIFHDGISRWGIRPSNEVQGQAAEGMYHVHMDRAWVASAAQSRAPGIPGKLGGQQVELITYKLGTEEITWNLAPVSAPIIKDNFNYIWWKRWWYFWPGETVMATSKALVMERGRQDARHLERELLGAFDWLDCVCAHAHLRYICMEQMHTCGRYRIMYVHLVLEVLWSMCGYVYANAVVWCVYMWGIVCSVCICVVERSLWYEGYVEGGVYMFVYMIQYVDVWYVWTWFCSMHLYISAFIHWYVCMWEVILYVEGYKWHL